MSTTGAAFLALFFFSFSGTASTVSAPTSAPLDGAARSYAAAGEEACFELIAPAPGTLLVEVTAAVAAPRLDFQGHAGGEFPEGFLPHRFLARRAADAVVRVLAAGPQRVCVRAQDEADSLGAVRLTSAFVELSEVGPVPTKDGDPDEDEPDPDPKFAKDGDPDEDEPDPDPKAAAPAELTVLCGRTAGDDHSDVLACARRLGSPVAGELANGWADDADVLYFVVRELRTVSLSGSGEGALQAELLNRDGDRLWTAENGGEGDWRLRRTLVPGLYYVRLTGDGHYGLELSREP
jgi:hypothetical protein